MRSYEEIYNYAWNLMEDQDDRVTGSNSYSNIKFDELVNAVCEDLSIYHTEATEEIVDSAFNEYIIYLETKE